MSDSPNPLEWVATDLDGTLFSRAWNAPESVAGTWRTIAGVEGPHSREASSWIRRETYELLRALSPKVAIVPVTARDADSFSRVAVDGLRLSGPAILANGAIVLDWDGQPDKGWEAHIADLLGPWEARLLELCESLIQRCGQFARPRLVAGVSRPAYLVAKAAEGWWTSLAGTDVTNDKEWWQGCQLAVLGHELQVLPPGLGKLEAVAYVQQTYFGGRAPLLTMGDMHADLPFMRLGGLMATPPESVLDRIWQNQLS